MALLRDDHQIIGFIGLGQAFCNPVRLVRRDAGLAVRVIEKDIYLRLSAQD